MSSYPEVIRTCLTDRRGALFDASDFGYTEIIRYIWDSGIPTRTPNGGIINEPLDQRSLNGALNRVASTHHVETAQLLLELGAEYSERTLVTPSWTGNIQMMKLFLNQRAYTSFQLAGAINEAVSHGHSQIVRLLLNHGANFSFLGDNNLIDAALRGHTETLRLVLSRHEVPVETLNELLVEAAKYGHIDTVKFLLDVGALPWANSFKAFVEASFNQHVDIMNLLRDRTDKYTEIP
jgi:ankyrin repeat protein